MRHSPELRQIRDFGQIVSDTLLFVIANRKSLFKAYFVFCGFFVAGSIVTSILLQLRIVGEANSEPGTFEQQSALGMYGIERWLVLLFGFLNFIAITGTTLSFVTLYREKGNHAPSVAEIWAYFKYYFLRLIGSALLLSVMLVVAILLCLVPAMLIGFASGFGRSGTTAAIITSILGFFSVIIPVLYLVTTLSLFFPIMIMENAGFWDTLNRCFTLIKKRWWRTFGVVFVIAVTLYNVMLLVIIPFSLASGGAFQFFAVNANVGAIVLYCIALGALQCLSIIPVTGSAITYYSYVEERESPGLMDRIAAIGATDVAQNVDVNEEY